jgi:hypothetical protein
VYPLLLDQLEALHGQVAALRENNPTNYINKYAAKQLAALVKLVFEVIPQNPERADGSADDAYREIRYLFENGRLGDEGLLDKASGCTRG